MDHWNYRVMKRDYTVGYGDEKHYSEYYISEVYYENYEPMAYSGPIEPCGESLEELEWAIDNMKECLDKPVLEEW